jgi:hypothetical protein
MTSLTERGKLTTQATPTMRQSGTGIAAITLQTIHPKPDIIRGSSHGQLAMRMVRQQVSTRRYAVDTDIELAVIARQIGMRRMFAFCAISRRWASASRGFAVEQVFKVWLVSRGVCPVAVGTDIEVAEQAADVVCLVREAYRHELVSYKPNTLQGTANLSRNDSTSRHSVRTEPSP